MAEKNKIIGLLLLTIASFSYANCTDSTSSVNVNIKTPPSEIIENVESQLIGSENGIRTLGRYKSDINYSMESNLTTSDTFTGTCGNINKLNFSINLTSKILLSKEVAHDSCQKEVTIKHEKEHYQLTVKALNDSRPFISNLLKDLSEENFRGYSLDSITDKAKNKEAQTTQKISEYIMDKIKYYNAKLDTEDNYLAEQSICYGKQL